MITFILIASILLGVLLKLPFLKIPLDRDYGILGYHSLFWLKGQKMPYMDTQENHPPGRWLLYALLLRFLPVSRHVFRYSSLVFLVVTNLVVFFITNNLFGITVALISTICFAILSSLPTFVWTQSSDEVQQILFTSLAVWGVVVADGSNMGLYLVIGLASFMALFFKQSAYINTLLLITLSLIIKGTSLVMFTWFLVGVGSGFVLTALFFKLQGIPFHYYRFIFALNFEALKTHIENIRYRRQQNSEPPINSTGPGSSTDDQTDRFKLNSDKAHRIWILRITKSLLQQTGFFLSLVLISTIILVSQPTLPRDYTYIMWLWLSLAVLTILLNRHIMAIHFIPLLVPLSILSGHGLVTGFNWLVDQGGVWWGAGVSTGLLGFSLFLMRNEIQQWIRLEKKGRGHIYVHDQEWEFNSACEGVGKYLANRLTDQDQIYVWGPEYEIYLWSGRPSPTKNLFCPRPQVTFTSDPLGAEKEIVDQLQANLPKYIIITALTEGFKRFERLLHDQYILEKKMYGEIEIHIRKDLQTSKQISLKAVPNVPLTSIIMLTFNAYTYTKKCVESIQKNTTRPHEIIFVDNASTDDTKEYLRKLVKQNRNYRYIENTENRGFATGNNQGMEVAIGSYFLLLNNDILVSKGWLGRLVTCAEQDAMIGLVGPITNWISGWQRVIDVPYTETKDFPGYANKIAKTQANRYTPRRRIAGFAMLIKRAVYDAIGGLDEQFGSGNYEDDDYCLRASNEGYKIMVAEDVYIHHFGSKTFQENNIDYSRSIEKNKALFKQKWPEINLDWLMEKGERLVDQNASLNKRANAYLEQDKISEAILTFENVLSTNPIDVEALYSLGFAHQIKGDLDQAMSCFIRVSDIVPGFSAVYNNLGLLNMQIGNLDEANSYLIKAIERDSKNLDAHRNLSRLMIDTGRYEEGVQLLQTILIDNPKDVQTLVQMGMLYTEAGKKPEAESYFNQVLALDPENKQAHQILNSFAS